MSGTILGIYKNRFVVQPTDSKPNRNVLVLGGPGSYKTQSYVITNIFNETKNSIVVTDPKGEVYEYTADVKKRQGYDVRVLNFANMVASDRYNPLDYVSKDGEATTVATKIVDGNNKGGKKDVWYYSQIRLLTALVLYAVHELPPDDRNIGGILDLLQAYNPSEGETGDKGLDDIFAVLDFKHPARRAYELGYKHARGEMQGSIIMSLLTTLGNYVDEEVNKFTHFSDFNLQDIGKKKMILYIILPVMDNEFEGLTALFFTQLFSQLYALGKENHAKIPQPINFILDEFVNLGKIEGYEEFLATCRGYGIGVSTIIQTITQLQDKYGKEKAESILGNCAVKYCLNASNNTTAEYIVKELGKATVRVETEGESTQHGKENTSNSVSANESYTSRDLMTVSEVKQLPDDTGLLIFLNKPPLKVKKAIQFKIFPQPEELLNQTHYRSKPMEEQLLHFELKQRKYAEQREVAVEVEAEKRKELEVEKRQKQEQTAAQEEQDLLEFFAE